MIHTIDPAAIVVTRRRGPAWVFLWDRGFQGWIHRTPKNTYRIFFRETPLAPISVGRSTGSGGWIPADREVKPMTAEIDTRGLHMTLAWR